ncbi:helix-turn-helix domain-containing protein [Thaumasiovibrio subtropicus]|uniref:helix-turn-helix domain-containing protein n=1 Tax=Thaumasiovibrio subtropicus TaxID=1891207 RepID=UPI00131E19E9|nr:helix-turn-helix transcriptional regulator [Thaumasiovibrio subtropicus]
MRAVNSEYLLMALRNIIKQNGLTYNNLAERINVPLSTLKRHLHSSSITLDRLITYCNEVNVTLEEVHKLASQLQHNNEDCFNAVQDEVFFQFPELYDFYREIKHKTNNLADIQARYDLDEAATYRFLRALEMIGLMKLHEGNRFSLIGPYHYKLSDDSKLSKQHVSILKQQAMNCEESTKLACSRMMLSEDQVDNIEAMVTQEILRCHNQNVQEGNTDKDYQRNILFVIGEHKAVSFSDGIKPMPGDFLNQVKGLIQQHQLETA